MTPPSFAAALRETQYLRVLERDAPRYEAQGWRLAAGWFYSSAVGRWGWFERGTAA